MKGKVVNYTDEMVAYMKKVYTPDAETQERKAQVEKLATEFNKPVQSIVAKLVREGVYVKASRTTKDGRTIVSKDELATKLGEILGLTEADASSLAKPNKRVLEILAKILG